MAEKQGSRRLIDIAQFIGAEIFGDGEALIARPLPAGAADSEAIVFAGDQKFLAKALASPVGAIIAPKGTGLQSVPILEVENPRAAFGMVLALFDRTMKPAEGIHPTAVVSESARLGIGVRIGPHAVVEDDAVLGDGVQIGAGSFVGPRCHLGDGAVLFPRVTLYHDVILGAKCRIHSGAVIGADGFGYAFVGGVQRKVPQVGRVVLGDHVEIGANTCIDRATCGDTVIHADVKLDNLVQIGHNCEVGAHTVMASQTGISGSVTIGERCTFGGQVGIGDHITVASDVQMAGQAGVMGDVEKGAYIGSPLMDFRHGLRVYTVLKRLPELFSRLKEVERKLDGA